MIIAENPKSPLEPYNDTDFIELEQIKIEPNRFRNAKKFLETRSGSDLKLVPVPSKLGSGPGEYSKKVSFIAGDIKDL